ncbi:hypothetical protein CKF59_05220 [Psittacicella gerlachiana]|uniref:Uncharacterized protein n=2 Tax=Psittacicella gerlachiana TaxID=2028574 RepID=A0A3A1Y8X0_9GAMM|nr:hypothetical protein CKF59_05220 [Psittacicella gerlachiana]
MKPSPRVFYLTLIILWIILFIIPEFRQEIMRASGIEIFFYIFITFIITAGFYYILNIAFNILKAILYFIFLIFRTIVNLCLSIINLFFLIIKSTLGFLPSNENATKQKSDRASGQRSNNSQQNHDSNNRDPRYNFDRKTNAAKNFLEELRKNETNVKLQFECIANILGSAFRHSETVNSDLFTLSLQVMLTSLKVYYDSAFTSEYQKALTGYQESRIRDRFVEGLIGINPNESINPLTQLNKLVNSSSFLGDRQTLALILLSSYYVASTRRDKFISRLFDNITKSLNMNSIEKENLKQSFLERKGDLNKLIADFASGI